MSMMTTLLRMNDGLTRFPVFHPSKHREAAGRHLRALQHGAYVRSCMHIA